MDRFNIVIDIKYIYHGIYKNMICPRCKHERTKDMFAPSFKTCSYCREVKGKKPFDYIEFFPDILKAQLQTKYKPNTIRIIEYFNKKILKLFNTTIFVPGLFRQYDIIIKHIQTQNNPRESRELLIKMLMLLTCYNECYDDKIDKAPYERIQHKIKDDYKTYIRDKISDDKDKTIPDFKNVYLKHMNAKMPESIKEMDRYILLSLYALVPPLRHSEYIDMKLIYKHDDLSYNDYADSIKSNFIDLRYCKMCICISKTIRTGELRTFSIKESMIRILKDSFIYRTDESKNTLFIQKTYLKGVNIRNNIVSLFGVGSSSLRKSFISYMYNNMKRDDEGKIYRSDIKIRDQMAYNMGHSVETASFVYRRNHINEDV